MFIDKHLTHQRHRYSFTIFNEIDKAQQLFNQRQQILPVKRNSSMCLARKKVQKQQEISQKSIGLSFTKKNRSKKSIRAISKENTDCNSITCSDRQISFKQLPPKRRSNASKFYNEKVVTPLSEKQFKNFNNQFGENDIPLLRQFQTSIKKENFIFLQKLGEGSFSKVYKARQIATNFIYALKVIQKVRLKKNELTVRLISQLKIQFYCQHVNIVKLYGVFDDNNYIYLIQQYAGKQCLYTLMKEFARNKKQKIKQIKQLVTQICRAIQYLHTHFIIHRDIKPENILIAPGNVVKITDFGWSIYNPNKQLRQTFCGTPLYLSPELISATFYDQTVDLWAIGVLTFELITGKTPFGVRCLQDLKNIVTKNVELSEIKNDQARDFIDKLLTKDMTERKGITQICSHPFVSSDYAKV